jgi:hypothetical protein
MHTRAAAGRGHLVVEAKQRVAARVQQNHKKAMSANLGVDIEKLYSDANYQPQSQWGSIKAQQLPGMTIAVRHIHQFSLCKDIALTRVTVWHLQPFYSCLTVLPHAQARAVG